MPASTITTAFTKQYSDNIYLLSQQRTTKFQPCVRVESVTSAEEAYWDTLGTVSAQKKAIRHGASPNNEQTHGRRKATMDDYNTGSYIDDEDKLKMIIDPTNSFAMTQAAALARCKDDAVIEAALGTALIGKTGSSSVAFKDDSISINGDGTVTSLGTLAAVATITDMTLDKMLLMLMLFNDQDVDPELEKFWAITPQDQRAMLNLAEVGSSDYNTVKSLAEGKVGTFAGFKFFTTTKLPKDAATGTGYRTFAWAKDGIILGVGKEVNSQIAPDPGQCFSVYVYSAMSIGAVRMEGAKVHECLTKVAVAAIA